MTRTEYKFASRVFRASSGASRGLLHDAGLYGVRYGSRVNGFYRFGNGNAGHCVADLTCGLLVKPWMRETIRAARASGRVPLPA